MLAAAALFGAVACTGVGVSGMGELADDPEPAPASVATVPDAERAPDRDREPPESAPEPIAPLAEAGVDEPLGVAVAPSSSRVLVIWSERAIALSDDDGATFHAVLEQSDRVQSVAFDERGDVWALVGARLGHRRSVDGRERWRDLPADMDVGAWDDDEAFETRLWASTAWVAIAVPHPDPERLSDILFTRDGGAHWSTSVVEATMSSSSIATIRVDGLRVEKGDRIAVLVEWGQGRECATTYATEHRGRTGAARLPAVVEYPETYSTVDLGHDGWGYATAYDPDEVGCVHPPVRAARDVVVDIAWRCGFPAISDVVVAHDATFARHGDALVSLARGTVNTLVDGLPPDTTLLAVDADLRALLGTDHGIVRREPDGRLTLLDPSTTLEHATSDAHAPH